MFVTIQSIALIPTDGRPFRCRSRFAWHIRCYALELLSSVCASQEGLLERSPATETSTSVAAVNMTTTVLRGVLVAKLFENRDNVLVPTRERIYRLRRLAKTARVLPHQQHAGDAWYIAGWFPSNESRNNVGWADQ
jgi:hypothetical protein